MVRESGRCAVLLTPPLEGPEVRQVRLPRRARARLRRCVRVRARDQVLERKLASGAGAGSRFGGETASAEGANKSSDVAMAGDLDLPNLPSRIDPCQSIELPIFLGRMWAPWTPIH
jgi:hypothetical protein